jgi:hypothetical protein
MDEGTLIIQVVYGLNHPLKQLFGVLVTASICIQRKEQG